VAIAASLVVRISTEYGSFVRGMKQAEKDLTRFGKQAKRLGRDLSTNLTLPIVALGAVLFKAASDLERSENMFEASFGGMADSARAWSETTASALTLSADDVRLTMTRFNELAVSMDLSGASALIMSQGLTQLTLDLMAYRNISEETASGALEAGLAGRMKGLRELGVVIKEADVRETALRVGLLRTGQTMTAAQLSLASYITMTEALSKANGEMARAGDKPAVMLVKIKQMAEEVAQTLGTALMPAMQTILGMVLRLAQHLKGLAEWFGRLPPWVRGAAVAIAGLAAAIGPLLWALGTLVLILPKLRAAAVLGFAWAANPVVLGILAVAGALALLMAKMDGVARANARMVASMGRRGAGFGSFEGEADAVNARLRAGFAGRTQTPAQVEANALAAAIAEANRLAAIERARLEAQEKMARLTRTILKDTKDIAAAMDIKFGGFKSIADSVKGMVGELKNATPAVLAWAQEMDRQAMAVEQRFAEMANNITESLTNLFSDVLMGQADAFQRFLNTIERMIADFAARQAVNAIGRWIGEALLSSYSPLGGAPAPAASLTGARSAALAGGDSFQVNVSFAPAFIDARSGAAWLRENEGVITEAVISGVRKSGAARAAIVGR
jgi:hypothetical protein